MNATEEDLEPAGFFVVRAPLLSIDLLRGWSSEVAVARQQLHGWLARAEVREAIAVASPSLLAGLPAWVRDPDGDDGQKVERALVRYATRMATRPTPFGLFAGCGVGTIGDGTSIRLGALTQFGRHSRIDTDVLDRLARRLLGDRSIRAAVRLRPNASLHAIGSELRYVEPRHAAGGRSYGLVVLGDNELVTLAAERARHGATMDEIAAAIAASDPEITIDEALGFVDSLIDAAILESELEPAVTGAEPAGELLACLRRIAPAHRATSALAGLERAVAEIDARRPFAPDEAAEASIRTHLVELGEPADARHVLQVDMQLGVAEATLDRSAVPELIAAARMIHQICPELDDGALMRQFCQQFEARYERREVPLLEALDEDRGIGFGKIRAEGNDPEPLLEGVHVPLRMGAAVGRPWGAFEEMLLRKLEERPVGSRAIQLDAADLGGLPRRAAELPDSFVLDVSFAARDAAAMQRGDYRAFLHLIDGPSGANWLGRFCHADPGLRQHVERMLRQEEAHRPDAVFAEIVHLPEGRTGNVLLRPVLRRYEIPFLGRSGAEDAHQLTPDDLVVTVWDGRVVLKSKRLQREVIPRLSSAHAFPSLGNLGVYRFLGALQTGGRSIRATWSWGALEPTATFLPRVEYGRVVLSLATWTLRRHHLAGLDVATVAGRFAAMQQLRERLDLPRWICISDADNALCVDLDHPLMVESAASLLRRRGGATLTEMFPAPDEAWISGTDGPHTHELLIPVARRVPASSPAVGETPWLRTVASDPVARVRPPGSEWLYLELYASPRSCDLALLGLAPTIHELLAADRVRRWFFLRMADEVGWHLRVRLHGDPRALLEAQAELGGVLEPMLHEGLIWKIRTASYHREVEHWGGPAGIELAEQVLCHDSAAALGILTRYADDPSALASARWQLALRGIDGLWAGLGLDLAARERLASTCRDGFAREFGLADAHEGQLSTRHRRGRATIEAVLGATPPWPEGCAALSLRDQTIAPLFAELHAREAAGALGRPVLALADRFAHLHVNRMLRSMLREQELVLMDALARHHRSALARARKRGPA